VPEYAQACLDAIAASGLGSHISMGGAFGLAHYYEYRPTHDVDAWWEEPVSLEQRQAIISLKGWNRFDRWLRLPTPSSGPRRRHYVNGIGATFCMDWKIDGTLYPDVDPPSELSSLGDEIDFLARLCAAWDFGVLPDWQTVVEVRRPEWHAAVDACRLLTSPAYHLLRRWHNLPGLPFLGSVPAYIGEDPNLQFV
jgi:hypothetical protein